MEKLDKQRRTISILTENRPGVLTRVAGLFARRGYNIHSLAVGVTDNPSQSRLTIVTLLDSEESERTLEQIEKQLMKLEVVTSVSVLPFKDTLERELLLAKISYVQEQLPQIYAVAELTKAKISDVSETTMILEMSGNGNARRTFETLLSGFTILEIVRSGAIALHRGEETINT
jgi:acetolactate synthase-1/3 small subunit